MKVGRAHLMFLCNACDRLTAAVPAATDDVDADSPMCDTCGEWYQCGECGHEINWRGDCLRDGGCPQPRMLT